MDFPPPSRLPPPASRLVLILFRVPSSSFPLSPECFLEPPLGQISLPLAAHCLCLKNTKLMGIAGNVHEVKSERNGGNRRSLLFSPSICHDGCLGLREDSIR